MTGFQKGVFWIIGVVLIVMMPYLMMVFVQGGGRFAKTETRRIEKHVIMPLKESAEQDISEDIGKLSENKEEFTSSIEDASKSLETLNEVIEEDTGTETQQRISTMNFTDYAEYCGEQSQK